LAIALSSISVVCSSLLLRSEWPGVGFRSEEGFPGNQLSRVLKGQDLDFKHGIILSTLRYIFGVFCTVLI
jgi:hypothetical protein